MDLFLQQQVRQAQNGNREALEQVIRATQDRIYGLALRMLWHPEDAKDATQEILIRVITHLGTFRGESSFVTWLYRVAANALLTIRKGRAEEARLTFQAFEQDLDEGISDARVAVSPGLDEALLLKEVKIGCTQAMLLCLDRPHRLAYILGEILELEGSEAAEVMEISPQAFRKRLSRARAEIVSFMQRKCGLVNPQSGCRCRRRVNRAIQLGRVDPRHLLFASNAQKARDFPQVLSTIRQLEEGQRAVALYRSHPDVTVPKDFVTMIKSLINQFSA
jgi:RNA polymerase sigma factor (sigma-70 family)